MRDRVLFTDGAGWLSAAAVSALTYSIRFTPTLPDPPPLAECWSKKSRSGQFTYRKGYPRLHATKGYRGKHKLWRKGR